MNTKTKIGLAAVITWTVANNIGAYFGHKRYNEAITIYRGIIEKQDKHITLLENQVLEARINV